MATAKLCNRLGTDGRLGTKGVLTSDVCLNGKFKVTDSEGEGSDAGFPDSHNPRRLDLGIESERCVFLLLDTADL